MLLMCFTIPLIVTFLRFCSKYRLFAGLWFGRKKPDFRTFLQPFASSLHALFNEGTVISGSCEFY